MRSCVVQNIGLHLNNHSDQVTFRIARKLIFQYIIQWLWQLTPSTSKSYREKQMDSFPFSESNFHEKSFHVALISISIHEEGCWWFIEFIIALVVDFLQIKKHYFIDCSLNDRVGGNKTFLLDFFLSLSAFLFIKRFSAQHEANHVYGNWNSVHSLPFHYSLFAHQLI